MPDGYSTTLSATAEESAAAVAALPRTYGVLGRYALLEMIGHGGMGVVWKAYDPLLDRKVALKLLASRGNVVVEAQAMARVQHPNVITVYDAGVQKAGTRELAYVAMELVEGRTLKAWLDAEPRSAEECLELFLLAGRGLLAAHDAGLVHRDFKPSNVLLGDDGRVRVSDFGLALVGGTGGSGSTSGSVERGPNGETATTTTLLSPFAGTPRYMAPEQLHNLSADARADQFAFCVALYEAVFGAHPFTGDDAASVAELRARVLEPPTPPARSRLTARLAPAILRGLSAEPAARWPSMHELLAALEAARGTRGKRLVFGAVAVTVLAVVAAIGWREAATPPRACVHAADALAGAWGPARRGPLATSFAALGDAVGGDVWPGVAATLDDWSARWRTLRIEACEADRNGKLVSPTLTARRECLDRRLGELDGLVQTLDKPNRTVALYATRAAHGLTPPESCLSALPPVDAKAAPPSLGANRDAVAKVRARIDRAAALRALGQPRPALDEAKAAAAAAGKIAWPPLSAEAELEVGRSELDVNATEPATDGFYRALWSAEAARDDGLRLEASMGLFKASLDASNYTLAGRWNETDKAIARHLASDGTRAARLAFDDMRLALYKGETKRCVASGEEALALADKASPLSPLVVSVMINLARCESAPEREADAVAILKRALPMSEKINGRQSAQTASVLTELGIRARRAHRYDEAVADYREALAIRERMVGPDNPDCASVHNNIGNVLRDQKRYAEAKVEFERAIAIWTKAWSADSPAIAVGLGGIGKIAMAEGRPAEAEPYFRRAVAITRAKRPPGHPDLVSDLQKLGEALVAEKKPEAVAVFEEALAAVEKDGDASAGDRAEARFWAARARYETNVRRAGAWTIIDAACKELDTPDSQDSLHECRAWLTAHPAAR
ncbi:MAG TPA: serine/threonine-protein kinase [Polyangia bacterium]